MKKKIISLGYVVLAFLILMLPILNMNNKKDQVSEIDNTLLPEFPSLNEITQEKIDNYISKRIGYRMFAIKAYELGTAICFNQLEHTHYALGKEGYIMENLDECIKDYQHLNLREDAELIEVFPKYLSWVSEHLKEDNVIFLYFLAPDKKTIYPEYMSDNINVYGEISRTDLIIEDIEQLEIPYIYPKAIFFSVKENLQIYNKKYDALHWNDLGNFVANQLIDEYLQEQIDNLMPLDETQFELKYEYRDTLANSYFPVRENVPIYYLKNNTYIREISGDDEFGQENIYGKFEHYINEDCSTAPSILILRDSYFEQSVKFYTNRYREVISVHNINYEQIPMLVEYYQPDIVLFENVERVFSQNFDTDILRRLSEGDW